MQQVTAYAKSIIRVPTSVVSSRIIPLRLVALQPCNFIYNVSVFSNYALQNFMINKLTFSVYFLFRTLKKYARMSQQLIRRRRFRTLLKSFPNFRINRSWPKDRPLVTVVMPTTSPFQAQKLHQMLSVQTWQDFEVFSSSDRKSRGKYVIQINESEEWEPNYLETYVYFREAEFNRNQKSNVSHCSFFVFRPLVNLLNRNFPERRHCHVLIAMPYFLTGGAERVVSRLSKELISRNVLVSLVSTLQAPGDHADASGVFKKVTPEVYSLPELKPDDWLLFISYLILSRGIKLIYFTGSTYIYSQLPALKKLFPNVKLVDQHYNEVGHTKSWQIASRYLDATVAENEKVFNFLNKYLSEEQINLKTKLIQNGPDLEVFNRESAEPSKLLSSFPQLKDKQIVAFYGRFSEEKAPLSFVKMAAKLQDLPNTIFVMGGDGPLLLDAIALSIKMGMEDRFIFPGVIDVKDFLSVTDVTVVPSTLDGRPNIIFESLSMEVPVVASNVGGIPEILKDSVTGFICTAEGLEEFAIKIRAILTDKILSEALRSNLRDWRTEQALQGGATSLFINLFAELLQIKIAD